MFMDGWFRRMDASSFGSQKALAWAAFYA